MSDEWVRIRPGERASRSRESRDRGEEESVSPNIDARARFGAGPAAGGAPAASEFGNVEIVDTRTGEVSEKRIDADEYLSSDISLANLRFIRNGNLNVFVHPSGSEFIVINDRFNTGAKAKAYSIPKILETPRDVFPTPTTKYINAIDKDLYDFAVLVVGGDARTLSRVLVDKRNVDSNVPLRPAARVSMFASGDRFEEEFEGDGMFSAEDLEGVERPSKARRVTTAQFALECLEMERENANVANGAYTDKTKLDVIDEGPNKNAWRFDAPVKIEELPSLTRYAIRTDDISDSNVFTGNFIFALRQALDMAKEACPDLRPSMVGATREGPSGDDALDATRREVMMKASLEQYKRVAFNALDGKSSSSDLFEVAIGDAISSVRGLNKKLIEDRGTELMRRGWRKRHMGIHTFIDFVINGDVRALDDPPPVEAEEVEELTIKGLLKTTLNDSKDEWLVEILGYFMIRHVLETTGEMGQDVEREPIRYWLYDFGNDDLASVAVAVLGLEAIPRNSIRAEDKVRIGCMMKLLSRMITNGVRHFNDVYQERKRTRLPEIVTDASLRVHFATLTSAILAQREVTSSGALRDRPSGEEQIRFRQVQRALRTLSIQPGCGGRPIDPWLTSY